MSSRGFILRMPDDDDSFDLASRQALSPNIVISRTDYFAARGDEDGGK